MDTVQFIPSSQRRLVLLASQADTAPVLIHGASGTGKGAIARWIHLNSARATKSFLPADRSLRLSDQLPGAQGGTLLITEIAEWPLSEQAALLDFLQSRTIRHPLNPGMRMLLQVRVIAATSHSLEGRAQGGLFNMDLLRKLNVFRIEMPSLRERSDEFEDITLGILGEITHELGKSHLRSLSPDAWKKLKTYDWPGNLRELRNVLRLATMNAVGDLLDIDDLPDFGHEKMDFRATREEFERLYLQELLETHGCEVNLTCEKSGIDKNTLIAKIQKYGLRSDLSPEGPRA